MECFKLPINLNIEKNQKVNKHNSIKSGLFYKKVSKSKPINKFPHLRLGHCSSNLGAIDVYVVNTSRITLETSYFRNNLYDDIRNILKDKACCFNSKKFIRETGDNKISGILNDIDFRIFFNSLNCYDNKLYIESFGNKGSTMCTFIDRDTIDAKLLTVVDLQLYKDLVVDLCISCSAGNDKVTFVKKNVFDEFKIVPNYVPLFCSDVMNASIRNTKYKKRKHGKLQIFKYNFYSTFKNTLNLKSNKSFFLELSAANMMNKLYGCWTFGNNNKILDVVKKFKVYDNFNATSSKEYAYRMEFRLKHKDTEHIYHRINKILSKDSFYVVTLSNFSIYCR